MSTDADDSVVDASTEAGEATPPQPDAGFDEPAEDRPSAGPSAGGTEAGEASDELNRLRTERDEYLDALRRLQAEFENFRKRTVRQQTELFERASVSLLEAILPVLDALDLALDHLGEGGEGASAHDAFLQVASLLRSTLAKEGLERIADVGAPFDPTRHDAVAHVEGDPGDVAHHGPVVSEVLRSGYLLKGKVLRPAMVKVEG